MPRRFQVEHPNTEMCRIWQKNQYILGYSSRTICRRDLEMV